MQTIKKASTSRSEAKAISINYNSSNSFNLNQDIESTLLRDNSKAKKHSDGTIRGIKCPVCGKNEAFANLSKGYCLICGRRNKCGTITNIREVYPDLYKDFSSRYPATEKDRNATARAYLESRGLSPESIEYKQGKWYDKETDKSYNTVCFSLIDNSDYHILLDKGGSNKRLPANAGQLVYDKTIGDKPKRVFIVESPIDALSLHKFGFSAVAVLSSNFSQDQYFLNNKDNEYVLAFDDDEAGIKANRRWMGFFQKHNMRYEVAIPYGAKDWNDILQKRKITDEVITDCKWYGRLRLSATAFEYYETWCEKYGDFPKVFEFNYQIYRGVTAVVRGELERKVKRLIDADIRICQTIEEYSDQFNKSVTHRLKISRRGKEFICEVNANELITRNNLRSALIKYDVVVWATDDELMFLIQYLVKAERPIIRKINYKGYDELSNCYVYENYLIDEYGNKHIISPEGYFKGFGIAPFTDSDLANVEITQTKEVDIGLVIKLLSSGYGGRGFTILSFWIATLFSHIIFPIKREFGILNIYGATHKGKSFLAKICFWILGIDDEGISADNTRTGNIRKMSQFKGIPIQFNEVERSIYLKSGLNIKNIFHWRALKTMGEKNNRNTTKTLKCETGVAFNNNPDIFTLPEEKNRTVSVYFPEDCAVNTFKYYEQLSHIDKEQFTYIGHYILKNRGYFEDHLKEGILHYSNDLKSISEADERLRNSHAQVLGTFHCLINLLADKNIISIELAKEYLLVEIEYVKEILQSRIDEIRTADTLVGRFFELLLNEPEDKETGYKTVSDKLCLRPNIATQYIINKHRLKWNLENLKQTLRNNKGTFIEAKSVRYGSTSDMSAHSYVFDLNKVKELVGIE